MDLLAITNKLITSAEELYGPRVPGFVLRSVEITERNIPTTWFPPEAGTVRIMLSHHARTEEREAFYQAAHEALHMLEPVTESEGATTLEEGLAVHFAERMVEREYCVRRYGHWHNDDPYRMRYIRACEFVDRLLKLYPGAIRMLRGIARFNDLTEQHFAQVCPLADATLVRELITEF